MKFCIKTSASDGDETIENSELDLSEFNWGSIVIIKSGKIYASIDLDVDSIKSDAEIKNWLSKYIEIK